MLEVKRRLRRLMRAAGAGRGDAVRKATQDEVRNAMAEGLRKLVATLDCRATYRWTVLVLTCEGQTVTVAVTGSGEA